MRFLLSSLAALFLLPLTAIYAQSPARHALFLVNSKYSGLPPLNFNAAALSELKTALSAAKFQISEERDLPQGKLVTEVAPKIMARLNPGDTLVFFYFGYAIQSDGDNYLVPIDFDLTKTEAVSFRAQSLAGFVQLLDRKQLGLKLILIDAATQSNEFISRGIAKVPGLGEPDFTDIKEVAYLSSTAKNAVPVSLSETERGLFAKHITSLIRKPGTTLIELLAGVPAAVAAESSNLNPYFTTQTTKPFRFTEPPPAPKVEPSKPVDEFISKDRVNKNDRQAYLYIRPGKFLMGCAKGDAKCEDHEKPQHEVTITKGFWMGETEVQVEAYKKFADVSTPKRKLPRAPVEHKGWNQTNLPMAAISPDDADAFCKWAGGRLPTEAEWEYAARGGKENEIVPLDAATARDKANFFGKQGNDRFDEVAPVRQFDPNGFGLFDMSGNLWEFTSDFYSKTYFAESPKEDPKGPASGKERVVRGGSWFSDSTQHLRISFRNKGNGGNIVGFRCVLPDSEETRKLLR